ncbi:MAG TPA: ABC transporter permease [Vicinamibacterales bacterium]|nr:ABC transporter permease [Vicinamibacterales bacterium]
MGWWRRLVRRGRLERDLDRELRYDFERRVEDHVDAGLSEEEARRQARLEFGGLDQIKERCRDARGTRWAHDLAQDLRYALRLLTKDRAFGIVAVLALGLGLGIDNTQFAIVNGYCLAGLPIAHADRVAYVDTVDDHGRRGGLSSREFEGVRAGASAFAELAAFAITPVALADAAHPADAFQAAYVSGDALRLLGRDPVLGRDFTAADDHAGAPAVVILSNTVWNTRYGADPAIVGQVVRIDDAPATVIGVMPAGFRFPNNANLWVPLARLPGLVDDARRDLMAYGLLRNGASFTRARSQIEAIWPHLNGSRAKHGVRRLMVQPINQRYLGKVTDPAWLAFMTVGLLVVLIACANVANLLLMRSVTRSREVAMRAALGASRGRIVRQLLAESAVVAMAGGILGLLVSALAIQAFAQAIPEAAIPYAGFHFDARVLAVLAAVCLGTVFVVGLAPALRTARVSVSEVLKSGGAATHDHRVRRWTTVFLTAEFGLTVILVSAVGLNLQAFLDAQHADRSFDVSHILTASVALPHARYPTTAARAQFYDTILARAGRLPSVSAMSFASALPLGGTAPRRIVADSSPSPAGKTLPTVGSVLIGRGYFQALGVQLRRGRAFTTEDARAGANTIIVNQRVADQFFPGENALGRHVRLGTDDGSAAAAPWLTIVGISPDIRQGPWIDADPIVYLPFEAALPPATAIIVRTHGAPEAAAPALRTEVRALDPDLPLAHLQTMTEAKWAAEWNRRISGAIVTLIALMALLLSTVGLYAVTAHGVAIRTREIGIRVVLGAERRQVVWTVLRGALVQVGLGLIVGIVLSVVWARLFGGPGIGIDPGSLASLCGVLLIVALVASVAPAWRAARVEPATTLRYQ